MSGSVPYRAKRAGAPKIKINLLPVDPFFETPAGRVMSWASSVGRYLVIFTEIVVILSFASRFTLDRQLNDLNGNILQQSYLVESFGNLENDVRKIQKKTEYLKQQQSKVNPINLLEIVRSSLPREVFLNSITLRGDSVSITGETEIAEALSAMVISLTRKRAVSALYVESVQNRTNGQAGFEFSFRIQARPTTSLSQETNSPTVAQGGF